MGDSDDLRAENERLSERCDRLETALHQIEQWSRAYPLKVFPKPDYDAYHSALKAADLTIDRLSADCMRHAVEGVGRIARAALMPLTDAPRGEGA